MPRAKPSDPVATAAAPRVARPRRKKSIDPVLAGFARLAETAVPAEAPLPEPITPPTPPLPVPAGDWHRLNLSACVAVIAVLAAALFAVEHFRDRHAANPAHAAILHYAQLCDSEIVEPLRTANDGTLTGEAALKLIETARPVIQRHTWSDLAEQLTALQDADGNLPQAETAAFLDTVSTGLRSVR